MKHIFELNDHQDPTRFRVGELPDHAYFIPFADEESTRGPRENSPFFHSLCGEWRFLWKPSLYEMDDFYTDGFDISDFKTIRVPETWQAHGEDYIQYISSPYPLVADPPRVPEKNPCAAYVKDFDWKLQADKRCELHFEGKDSCIYVWMNGHFVGYGEVPHNDSAFDVTPYLKNGQNRLCVLVLKWCSGTYFDDQDKIRLSGLFREAYILERAERGLRDFLLNADSNGNFSLSVDALSPVEAEIYDGERLLASSTVDKAWEMKVDSPALWSAEKPYLYDLVLTCDGEVIRQRFGFRTVEIKDAVFTVNGQPVKFYGVNRHDSNPDTGYVTDVDFMRHELVLMKQHNINAIRTSHYPNDPRFYEMCNELGFYVMSEADQECHGMTYLQESSRLVSDPAWGPCIHDRIDRMYQAFKNVSAIVIWSLGNESSWGANLKNEGHYLKQIDPTRPVHYEGLSRQIAKHTGMETAEDISATDFVSHMYSPFEARDNRDSISDRLADPLLTDKPLVLCEYSHAMGNSCGDLRFYDEVIQKEPRFLGGFIWEWCDHAMRIKDQNGTAYFGYGGDFGEKHHLHNVCMDGVVTPDRVPHSNLLEAKAVFAPVRVTRNADGSISILNRHAFSDFTGYDLTWKVVADTVTVEKGVLKANPAPGQSVTLPLTLHEPYAAQNAALTVTVSLAKDTAWARAGHTVAAFSFPLEAVKKQAKACIPAPVLTESRVAFTVSGDGFSYTFRKDEGVLGEMTVKGKPVLAKPLAFNCFRAPTDNDITASRKGVEEEWRSHRRFGNIEYPELSVHDFKASVKEDHVRLTGDFLFGVQGRKHIAKGTVEYRIYGNGRIDINQKGAFNETMPYFLPRYGYTLSLADVAKDIKYYGYGPAECYEDKISHALLGQYDYTPDDPAGNWEKPQESGSHCYTDWLTLSLGDTALRISGEKFSFCATGYDIHQMAAVGHRKDLTPMDRTDLYVDYRMSGVGSHSCGGQDPLESCRINAGEAFDFTIEVEIL